MSTAHDMHTLKAAFHDTDIDTYTNILTRILAKMSVSWNAAFNVCMPRP